VESTVVAGVATDVVEFQLLKVWLLGRGHSEVGTETRHILQIIKTGTNWPVDRPKYSLSHWAVSSLTR
jgi:hypothetical protein